MFLVGLFSWWYTLGWKRRAVVVGDGLTALYDYFSIDLLIRTLFAPFRQISAGRVDGPLAVQLQAVLDKLVSRVIGAVMRSLLVVIGSLALVVMAVIGLVRLLVWPIVPALPIVAAFLAMTGWIPWQI